MLFRHKVGLLNLAEELRNVSRACMLMGGYCHIKCSLAALDGLYPENPYITAIGFLRTSSATQYGCTIVSASVIGMLRIYWPNVE